MIKYIFYFLLLGTLMFASCSSTKPFIVDYECNYATPVVSNGKMLVHKGFTVSYLPKYKIPEWVSYRLIAEEVVLEIPRCDGFYVDPDFTNCAVNEDYTGSGYDRGHFFPAADAWTPEIMTESFYYTNVAPQKPSFNRGIWASLEEQVREWAVELDTVYVVTGSYTSNYSSAKTIGNGIIVPTHFYKVVVVCKHDCKSGIAFLLSNTTYDTEDFWNYAVTIDELETITGVNFCEFLPDNIESEIEKTDAEGWLN
ncbi:MAG: DNA/RNA non-specific endonuclease [Bacteroidales bacterium]|nr:DNA/RNA non-specific endonuclease [Bacteroidales bacterium]MDD2205095.1 DNA/RNA non-specific endonuclease [Bacteroidales bacterium]MDD3914577.1 DNA/RNA non-specific endonuclease [Bacteroidales bacterium]MDD4634478.1 DNA/RNA non-specific endonuclease [Bacteroidales bacterium]